MKKYILVIMLSIGLLIFIMPNGANAGPAEDACNDAVVGQRCDFTTPVQNIRGGGQSGGPQTGFCDRSNGNPDANSNPLICRSSQNQNTNFQTDWEDCAVAGDRCRSGGTDGTCASRTVGSGRGQRTEIYCNTTSAAPSGAPGGAPSGAPGGAPSGAPGGVAPGTSSSSSSSQNIEFQNPIGFRTIPELIAGIINALLGILGAITVAVLVMSGFKYMTSSNPGEVGQALDGIKNAVIGLIIIMGAFLITQYVITALAV